MTRLDIESIKDAVYELEGLLELADLREDKVTALLPLMKNKLKIINTLFSEESDFPEEEIEGEEIEIEEEEVTVSGEELPAPSEEEEKEPEEPVAPEQHEAVLKEEIEEPSSPEPLEVLSVPEVEEFVLPGEDEEVSVAGGITAAVRTSGSGGASSVKPAFCINDRFRFRRELFKNSDREFENAMNIVTGMDSYDEAEEYFIGELGWDYDNPEVSDFMAIIRGYFEK